MTKLQQFSLAILIGFNFGSRIWQHSVHKIEIVFGWLSRSWFYRHRKAEEKKLLLRQEEVAGEGRRAGLTSAYFRLPFLCKD
jgi:hypothetical protein